MDRRSFLCRSAVITAALVRGLPNSSFAQTINSSGLASGSESISRQFARWVAALRYEDLPSAVIDRAKGVTLHALASALQGYSSPGGQEAMQIVSEQNQGVTNGATILVQGFKAAKGDAVFANAEMILAGGKWDTFRMLTHPSTTIIPAALAAAETGQASGKEFLTGVAAGYEVMERLAGRFIPSVMARGFHAGPVFGIFGAAIAAARLMRLTRDQVHGAIAQCVNLASGNLEGARSGGRSVREGAAVRNALLAAAMAKHGTPGGETILEGEAGFYHSYVGNNLGRLTYSFGGETTTDLGEIT